MSDLVLPNSTLKEIKMVIFDKDGTLMDVHYYWCAMIEFRATFIVESLKKENIDRVALHNQLIDNMGIDLETKKMKKEGPVGIKSRKYIIDVAYNTIKKYTNSYTKEMVVDIFKQVDTYSKSKLKEIVKVLDGVEILLEKFKKGNITISIATTDLSSRAVLAMQCLGLDSYFSNIAGADLVKNAKPSPDLVEYLIDKTGLNINNIVLVGDSMADLDMAKNAKCKFLGVKTGLYSNAFIQQSEYLVENLKDVEVLPCK